MKTEETKVAYDVCLEQLQKFLDAFDLEITAENAEEEASIRSNKKRILSAMERGQLVVDDQGRPVYATRKLGQITFNEPTGNALMVMDQTKEGEQVKKTTKVMAALTGRTEKEFSLMPLRDYKDCAALANTIVGGS